MCRVEGGEGRRRGEEERGGGEGREERGGGEGREERGGGEGREERGGGEGGIQYVCIAHRSWHIGLIEAGTLDSYIAYVK